MPQHDDGGVVFSDQGGDRLQLARRLAHMDRADGDREASVGVGDRDADPRVTEVEAERPAVGDARLCGLVRASLPGSEELLEACRDAAERVRHPLGVLAARIGQDVLAAGPSADHRGGGRQDRRRR